MTIFHVPAELEGQTIVAALRHWLPGTSWSDARRLVSSRRMTVNGAVCVDHGRRLRTGDVVHLFEHPRTPQPTAEDVQILYCDPHVVVVVKPALMTTVRHREERHWPAARKNLQPTLDEVLPRILAGWESPRKPDGGTRRGRSQARPGTFRRRGKPPRVYAVHRLDRDTSGVMVFARTPAAQSSLIRQFKKHSNERVYLAVVHGRPTEQTIESFLVRDRGDGLRGSTNVPGEGERAVTHVRPLEDLGDYSLVECALETGRTHQIRIHLSERGHLVCGDPLYRRRLNAPPVEDKSGAPRLALHAARLAFDHPVTGNRIAFEAPLPDDLERFIRRLRRQRRGR